VVQETDKIKDHIDAERGKLERDLHEIEDRFDKAKDWRHWFDRKPVQILGAAAAGGFVLSMLLRRSSDDSDIDRYDEFASSPNAPEFHESKRTSKTSSQMDRMASTLDNTVAALLGVASRKVRDFVADVVPNFREEYREVETRRAASRDDSQMSAD